MEEEEVDSLSTYLENTSIQTNQVDPFTLQELDRFLNNPVSPPSLNTPPERRDITSILKDSDPSTYLTPNNSSNSLVSEEENSLNFMREYSAAIQPQTNLEIYEQIEFEEEDSEEEKPLHKQPQLLLGQRHHRIPSEVEDFNSLFQNQKDINPLVKHLYKDMNSSPINLPPINSPLSSNTPIQFPNSKLPPPNPSVLGTLNSVVFRPGHSRNASTSSTASNGDDDSERSSGYSSSDTLEEVDSFSFPGLKKYRQPITMRGTNLTIGPWNLKDSLKNEEWISIDIKFLFGRRKIKYEISNRSKSKANLVIEYSFSQICGLDITPEKRLIVVELADPPTFSAKERGKYSKVSDFTSGNASVYPRHHIQILAGNFDEFLERLRTCDKRLRELAKQGLSPQETIFPPSVIERMQKIVSAPLVTCDWDNENCAVVHCSECNANYCSACDEVLHRNANKKGHSKVLLDNGNSSKTKKNKKRKKSDRCRCGTGATKGTLGEPCTGNRCPCFSNNRGCESCGCKNCANPIKRRSNASPSTPDDASNITATQAVSMIPIPAPSYNYTDPTNSRHIRSISM
jgi:hypothetical protein